MFKKISEYKDFIQLLSGHIVAQFIAYGFTPFLTRLYSPADFATLGIMLASANVLYEVYTLKYERSIVITSQRVVAMNILFLCFMLSVFMTILFILVGVFWSDVLIRFKEGLFLLWIVPLITLFMSATTSVYYWFQHISQVNLIAKNRIIQMFSIGVFSLLLGMLRVSNGLVIGYLMGWFITFLAVIIQLFQTKFEIKYLHRSIIRKSILKYQYYPLFNTIPSIMQIIAQSAPFYLITLYYGEKEGGFFNLCKQVIQIPFSFISITLTQVYLRKISEHIQKREYIFPILKNNIFLMMLIISFAMSILFLSGETLFGWIFGKNWMEVGYISKIYIFSVSLYSIYYILSIVYPALHLIKWESGIKVLYFIVVFLILYFRPSTFNRFILIYTLCESFVYGLGIILILFFVRKYDKNITT